MPSFKIKHSRESAVVVAIVALAAFLVERRERQEEKKQDNQRRLTSHPFIAWILENLGVIGFCVIAQRTIPNTQGFLPKLGQSLLQKELALAILAFYTNVIYDYVPRFSIVGRPPTTLQTFYDWMLTVSTVAFVAFVPHAMTSSKKARSEIIQQLPRQHVISPLLFLMKLAVMRFGVDLGFYWGHRALHTKALYWLHRYHHNHYKPVVATNYHFHPLDLIVEALLPIQGTIAVMKACGIPIGSLEQRLLVAYMQWHEGASHCSKPLPAVTYFPPLAPLYRLVLGNVDAENVQHHETHHNLFNCNYGITIWPDILMGTRKRKIIKEEIVTDIDPEDPGLFEASSNAAS